MIVLTSSSQEHVSRKVIEPKRKFLIIFHKHYKMACLLNYVLNYVEAYVFRTFILPGNLTFLSIHRYLNFYYQWLSEKNLFWSVINLTSYLLVFCFFFFSIAFTFNFPTQCHVILVSYAYVIFVKLINSVLHCLFSLLLFNI